MTVELIPPQQDPGPAWGPLRTLRRALALPPNSGILVGKSARLRLGLAVVGALALSLLEVAALAAVVPLMTLFADPNASGRAIDVMAGVIGSRDRGHLALGFAVLMLGLYVVKALATIGLRWWQSGFINREQVRTATTLFDYYLRAPYSLHLKRGTADFVSTANDAVGQVYSLVIGGALVVLADAMTIVAITATLLFISPIPTLVAGAYLALASWMYQRWARARAVRYGTQLLAAAAATFRAATDGLGSVKLVKMRGNQDFFVARYGAARWQSADAGRRAAFVAELPKHILEILFVLGIGLITGLALLQGAATALTSVALFAAAGFRTLPSIVRLLASLNNLRVGRPSLEKVVADTLAAKDWREQREDSVPIPFTRELRLEGITYSYPGTTTEVLRDVTVSIPHGSSVALVGGSGAGKTTLVDVVQGLLTPTAGRVLVDSRDIADAPQSWRHQIGTVPQEVWSIAGSLRENVAFGVNEEDIDEKAVVRAIELAQLDDVVQHLPQGLDTDIGERGGRLSGGQRQRIGIARALYTQPSLLVLDEATSALDSETERHITDAIKSLHGHVTTVIVAHRLSTVRHCDKVVFMKHGRVDATGTFDELAAGHPDFARLVALGRLT